MKPWAGTFDVQLTWDSFDSTSVNEALDGALRLSPGYSVGHERHPAVDTGRFRFLEPVSLGDRKLAPNPNRETRSNV
jgi:hypothetical protein